MIPITGNPKIVITHQSFFYISRKSFNLSLWATAGGISPSFLPKPVKGAFAFY